MAYLVTVVNIMEANAQGVVPGEPPYGTGEVVIAAGARPPTDLWVAEWHDTLGHLVDGLNAPRSPRVLHG